MSTRRGWALLSSGLEGTARRTIYCHLPRHGSVLIMCFDQNSYLNNVFNQSSAWAVPWPVPGLALTSHSGAEQGGT